MADHSSIGIVIVSHSARLAEGVCELAAQVAQGRVRLAAAGGTGDPENPIGTDAFRVLEAIESVYSESGVVVLMDLGSALLSAETALELLDEPRRAHVRLSAAPLVEGAVAAAAQAAAGAGVDEILAEARQALEAKAAHLGEAGAESAKPSGDATAAWVEALATVANPHGLHARPAAALIRLARRHQAKATLENITSGSGPVDAAGINGLLTLGARQGHRIRVRANGLDAGELAAGLASFLESGCSEAPAAGPPAASGAALRESGCLPGMAAAAGIAWGPLFRLQPAPVPSGRREIENPEAEWERLLGAVRGAAEETRALRVWAAAHAGAAEAGIFDAQLLYLEDPELLGGASRIVFNERANAEYALQAASEELAARLGRLEDAYLRARAADVADVAGRILRRLAGAGHSRLAPASPCILAAHDLTPSEVKTLDPATVLGICLEGGSPTAHSVILARAMSIPVVTGAGPRLMAHADGTVVAVDGERGEVWVEPDTARLQSLAQRRDAWIQARREAEAARTRPAATRDGRPIRVLANLSDVAETAAAVAYGAEGVGVLRTEFLFVDRATPPSEEEQFEAYSAIANTLEGRRLTIRTLDIGGDKPLPYLDMDEEANPFLGWRGIRVTLSRPDILKTQLRAILRAGVERPVEILLPMISSLSELRRTRAVLAEVEAALTAERIPFHCQMKVGVMIETAAAVAIAGPLARESAFFSIGTNDLVQYVMAADRTNPRVAEMADPFEPAVLAALNQAVLAAHEAGIAVTLCGEFAANTIATGLLIGLGVGELSVSAPLVPQVKQAIAQCSVPACEDLAREALKMDTSREVRELLQNSRR